MAKSTSVLRQAEGFYLQETRFLYHLLNAESGDSVYLEFFGDVATEKIDGAIITEEDKSTLKSNPVQETIAILIGL